MPKRQSKTKLVLCLLLVVTALLYVFVADRQTVPPGQGPEQTRYDLQKTGAGAIADYTRATTAIHSSVDQALSQAKITSRVVQDTAREVPRQSIEGLIRWHTRELAVSLPSEAAVKSLTAALQKSAQRTGAAILATEHDRYQGAAATRIDIGLEDQVDGEPVRIVADKLYLLVSAKPQAKEQAPDAKTKVHGKMAIIIDDFGYSQEPIAAFANLDRPVTFSVLPNRPYTTVAASRALSAGKQVMVHLPMEPLNQNEQHEPQVITTDLSDGQIRELTRQAIAKVPGAIGINNHQGSRATADQRVMRNVLAVAKNSNLFFVDSRTHSSSAAFELSKQSGLKTGENDLFIDNSADIGAIKRQLATAAQMAQRDGQVTVIGHARMSTVTAVQEAIPELEAAGIELVFVSELVQ